MKAIILFSICPTLPGKEQSIACTCMHACTQTNRTFHVPVECNPIEVVASTQCQEVLYQTHAPSQPAACPLFVILCTRTQEHNVSRSLLVSSLSIPPFPPCLHLLSSWFNWYERVMLTSAVFGTMSQKTSSLISPCEVCKVTAIFQPPQLYLASVSFTGTLPAVTSPPHSWTLCGSDQCCRSPRPKSDLFLMKSVSNRSSARSSEAKFCRKSL